MFDCMNFGQLSYVKTADNIRIDIFARVIKAVAYARLSGQMNDDVRRTVVKNF